ncbi:MAG: hypothetical protein AB1791_23715 [Chloroflexota bacterium]
MSAESVSTPASLQTFLTELIDYAGLFPPAALPLAEAFRLYTSYRQAVESWMLSRFIIPAARLAELTTIAGRSSTLTAPMTFSTLGRGGSQPEDFLHNLAADLSDVAAFRQEHGAGVVVDVLETRLPAVTIAHPDWLEMADEQIRAAGLRAFYEVPAGPTWQENVAATMEAISHLNEAQTAYPAGFKLRCGGVEASAFPSAEQVAWALTTCQQAGVAMKATAGLHHPLRRYDQEIKVIMHGFLNVVGAAVLAHVHPLGEKDVTTILLDDNPRHFTFSEDTFAWRGLGATTAEIAQARQQVILSFGSCSFEEPRHDLRVLGFLRPEGD